MCAPKAGSYPQAAAATVRTSELSDAQAALAAIAKEKKFLDVKVKVRCPNGEAANSTARLDTSANTDVVSPDLAILLPVLKSQQSAVVGEGRCVCRSMRSEQGAARRLPLCATHSGCSPTWVYFDNCRSTLMLASCRFRKAMAPESQGF
jgi:hypothetical protein